MTFTYDEETDSLYIRLADRPSAESAEIAPDVIADYDDAGRLVALDIQHARENTYLAKLDLHALPFPTSVTTDAAA